jgi:multidrug resistance efflux pump
LDDLKLEIETTKQTLDKLKIEYDQLDVEKAQKIADTKKEYEMKDLEVKIAKNTLDNLRNNENDDVRLIKNTIKQKEKQIATIMKKYDAYVIKANFDGVITKINLQL